MSQHIEVVAVVADGQVDYGRTCQSCGGVLVQLAMTGIHGDGVLDLPPLIACPNCGQAPAVVAEYRMRVAVGEGMS